MRKIENEALKKELMEKTGYLGQFSCDVSEGTELWLVGAGEYIIRGGVRPEYLFYLCSGRAKLYTVMENGRVSLIDFFTAPCFIGEIELLRDDNEVMDVMAMEDCYCLTLPLRSYRRRLLGDACFLRNLCLLLGIKNYRTMVTFTRNQTFKLSERLASFILLTENQGMYREKHTEASEYLGVTYRHYLYVLSDFVSRGYLRKEEKGYRILDRKMLRDISENHI